ncbi:hypothetical protein Patl1_36124 [Pistacia atlantica]|nr:hypothetical protein Patl1_36124 [Pistacia atlantica]
MVDTWHIGCQVFQLTELGIRGLKTSLLEEFGICLLTYDIPGFGESDPHPSRNVESSVLDMLFLASSVGVNGKFWVLGYILIYSLRS